MSKWEKEGARSEGPLREQNRVGESVGFSGETALTGCIVVLIDESWTW